MSPPACLPPPVPVDAATIHQAHHLYCHLTGQTLRLGFDRERMWFELLRAGHTLTEVRTVIRYLQREIAAQRRHVGALKLSNLLQPDRFEEDLQISRVHLRPPPPSPVGLPPKPTLSGEQQEQGRRRALAYLHQLKFELR